MMKWVIVATLFTAGILLSRGWEVGGQTSRDRSNIPFGVSSTEAPKGAETLAASWIRVAVPDLGVLVAAVARPSGVGPFPSVILLHGSHGFARQYVEWAQELARAGFLAVAGCWFSGGGGAGSRFVSPPIPCPEAPPLVADSIAAGIPAVNGLVQAARALPGADPDRLAPIGHSRGGGAALAYLLAIGNVQAAVLHSSGYASQPATRAAEFKVPMLILHGTADGPFDGGSSNTNVEMAREFERALRRHGKPVEATYYEGGGHNTFFTNATQHDDEITRMIAFLRRRLE